jgi:PTH1 family peptidyl-tRNA hydrolase
MNHSGLAVQTVCQFYRIESHEILVVHDDLDLPVGRIKFKSGGGHGGHNGLRDITQQIGNGAFHRLRLGIGHPGNKALVLNYVLGQPSKHDRQLMNEAIERGIDGTPTILLGHFEEAMRRLNG